MTHSSQAGLATLRGANPVPTELVVLPSGVSFELRLSRHDNQWYCVATYGPQSPSAEAVVGLGFTVGANPLMWARGYAMRVQTEINKWARG